MQITIEKVETIKFDCDAERQRILSAFENGPQQDTLIQIVNEFEKGNLDAVATLMKPFTRDDWENLHWTITDIMVRHIRDKDGPKTNTTYRFTHCKL